MDYNNSKLQNELQADDVDGECVDDDLPPPPGSGGEDDNASSTISPTTTTNGSSIALSHIHSGNIQQTGSGQRLLVSPRPVPRKNGGCMPTNPDLQVIIDFHLS